MQGLSIIIPTYKEKKNLKNLIQRINRSLKNITFEIIIIDDESNDGTAELLKKIKLKNKNLKFFIRKKKPRDLSKSCVMGFQKAKNDIIVVMDGDLQHKPEEIKRLYNKIKINNYDIVVGNRNLTNKKNEGLKFYRLVTSIVLIFIVNFFLGFRTNDPMSGFFAFKKKIYLKNKKKLFNRGYKILLDLIYSSSPKPNIIDVFIRFKSRGEGYSKINYKIIYFLGLIVIQKLIYRIIKIYY
jgi:dolichol-phosphate mannosyltransferase|tara:strand:+ start:104 stop:823 length:720 start_codon:yes stop_codon:yes gene_type:complete